MDHTFADRRGHLPVLKPAESQPDIGKNFGRIMNAARDAFFERRGINPRQFGNNHLFTSNPQKDPQ